MIYIKNNEIYEELLKITSKDNIKKNEPMKYHTSFHIGGSADWFIILEDEEKIKKLVLLCSTKKIPLYILGNGTNVLVKDNGIRGIVLKVNLNSVKIKENEDNVEVTVGAGKKITVLAKELVKNGISGLEFASGIPGTIGGAVYMNAGAYGKEIKDIVISTKYIDNNGSIHIINNEKQKFEYRKSIFNSKIGIILETTLKLEKGKIDQIEKQMEDYSIKRKNSQPIGIANAGSTFKREKDFITAKLIDEAGLKGFSIGDAEVSTVHAGFIVNKGEATAKDVLELIEYIKKQIYIKFKKEIHLEIEVIGE